jgi:uroporphyrinogen-III decarboxylase
VDLFLSLCLSFLSISSREDRNPNRKFKYKVMAEILTFCSRHTEGGVMISVCGESWGGHTKREASGLDGPD